MSIQAVGNKFRAFVVEAVDGTFTHRVKNKNITDLPENELLVEVHYSSLNYKDALSASGNKGVTRNFPHTPGIDAAGVVVHDKSGKFLPGDKVIVTSYDLGMNTDGGFAEYICVPSEWAVSLPSGMTLKKSMQLGTAGLTAAISVSELAAKVKPEDGSMLVTGATGGVGSLAVKMLSLLGYKVCALTGKTDASDYLKELGAQSILSRDEFLKENNRPMLKDKWSGVVDCVGGEVLNCAIKSTSPQGVITCCGMAGSAELNLTVFPFILRGVRLIGIDSQNFPMELRVKTWAEMADLFLNNDLDFMTTTISIGELSEAIENLLAAKQTGRKLIEITDSK